MRKLLSIIVIVVLFAACGTNTENKETEKKDSTETSELVKKDIPTIALGEFDTKAGGFVEKEIMVSGIVDHVCKHGGKKILLVSDNGDVHVESKKRFEESLVGSEIVVTGIVKEFRIDEAHCLKMEEDNINSHKEDADKDMLERKNKQITYYRDSMKNAGVDHLSYYSLEYVSHKDKKQ